MDNTDILKTLRDLELSVATQKSFNDRKEQELKVMASRAQQGMEANTSTQALERNLARTMGNFLVPGNVGDINKVHWPFFFSIPFTKISPGQNIRTQFSVTQEAGFSYMALIKSVYDFDPRTNELTYIDPDEAMVGEAQGLSYSMRDAQSSREFFNAPMSLDGVGNPRWPSALPSPYFFLPNSVVEFSLINNHPSNVYVVHISLFGYRIRVEGSQNILSTTYG